MEKYQKVLSCKYTFTGELDCELDCAACDINVTRRYKSLFVTVLTVFCRRGMTGEMRCL